MIKTWQKWFVCIFATIFVSVFFVYDAIFIEGNKVPTTPPSVDVVIPETDLIEPDIKPIDPDNGDTEEDDNKDVVIDLPIYTNSYTCLNDALSRFENQKYYSCSYTSSGTSLSIKQTVKGVKYFSGTNFGAETFAYCDSSLGQRFYERVITNDMQTFNYIKTNDIDENYNYNLSNCTNKTYNYTGLTAIVGTSRTRLFALLPVKGKDKQAKFDSTSNKNYYICAFVYNVEALDKDYVYDIKRESGASSVKHSYLQITYYVSKTTGLIEKVEQSESYAIELGVKLNVTYYQTTSIKYYTKPFEIKF